MWERMLSTHKMCGKPGIVNIIKVQEDSIAKEKDVCQFWDNAHV